MLQNEDGPYRIVGGPSEIRLSEESLTLLQLFFRRPLSAMGYRVFKEVDGEESDVTGEY
jgi:hypothetical protein